MQRDQPGASEGATPPADPAERPRRCPACGATPRDRARYCDQCATPLPDPAGRQEDALDPARLLALRLRAVASVAAQVARDLDPERLLDDIPPAIREALGYDLVTVFLIDPEDESVWMRSTAGLPIDAPLGVRLPRGEGVLGRAVLAGEGQNVADVRSDPDYVAGPGLEAVRSELASPILVQGRVLGVLDVQSLRQAAFTEADEVALAALAAELGVAIENARLFQRVQSNEHRLATIIDAVPFPLAVYEPNGRIVLTNHPLRVLYRLEHDPVGMTIDEVTESLPEETRGVVETIARLPFHDGPPPAQEIVFPNPPRTFIRRITPVVVAGETQAYIVLYQDVTAERAALRAKDQLLSIAAHELRTPLTALLGFIDLIQTQIVREPIDLDLLRRRMTTIQREARRLAGLVEELLGLAQLESGEMPLHPSEVDAAEVVRRVLERFATAQREADRLVVSLPREPVPCRWDEGRVDQILTNLVDNALKYSPSESPVEVRLDAGSPEVVEISVRDHGSGLTEQDLARLFQPFSRLSGSSWRAGGLGIGLYVSRALAERLGGRLWLESEPGQGVLARLTLPRDVAVRDGQGQTRARPHP